MSLPDPKVVAAFYVLSSRPSRATTLAPLSKNEALDVLEATRASPVSIANLIVRSVAIARGYVPIGDKAEALNDLIYMSRKLADVKMHEDDGQPLEECVAAMHAHAIATHSHAPATVMEITSDMVQYLAQMGCARARFFSGQADAFEELARAGCLESCWRLTQCSSITLNNNVLVHYISRGMKHMFGRVIPYTVPMGIILLNLAKHVSVSDLDYELVADLLHGAMCCAHDDVRGMAMCAYDAFRSSPSPRLGVLAFNLLTLDGPSIELAVCQYAGIGTKVCIEDARRTRHVVSCDGSDHTFEQCRVDWFGAGEADVEGAGHFDDPPAIVLGRDEGEGEGASPRKHNHRSMWAILLGYPP